MKAGQHTHKYDGNRFRNKTSEAVGHRFCKSEIVPRIKQALSLQIFPACHTTGQCAPIHRQN